MNTHSAGLAHPLPPAAVAFRLDIHADSRASSSTVLFATAWVKMAALTSALHEELNSSLHLSKVPP
jgi:hypothetical protein